MKKCLSVFLAVLMLCSLVACQSPTQEKIPPVDYSIPLPQWFYQPESDDSVTQKLINIDTCPYSTAGASLKQLLASVGLLQLTKEPDWESKLDAYLAGMTDTQRDFFSFQWQMRLNDAKLLLVPGNVLADMLGDVGMGDLSLTLFSSEELNQLHRTVTNKLQHYGVVDQWKNHRDIEPFIYWNE